jgi:MFS family permease
MEGEASAPLVRLGLRENLGQFWLLVGVNALVGGMVGLERSLLPLLGEQTFHLTAHAATLSFLVAFGATKGLANYLAGHLGDRLGRKGILVLGWALALPVPFLLIWAPTWSWILAANVLLGVSQGFTWSTTVIMKIDLVGPARRGLAMGLNEGAGYLAVAVSALLTAQIAESYGLRPAPFYLGVGFAGLGFLLSLLVVRETKHHAEEEQRRSGASPRPAAREVFWSTTWQHPQLRAVTQAGLVNNLNDGLAWGLLPLLFAKGGLGLGQIGVLAATYPAVWGVSQLATGGLSDRLGRRPLIVGGMLLQGIALLAIAFVPGLPAETRFRAWMVAAVVLGVGTAMVYPTLLAAIGDVTQPSWRGSALGVYRLWRDLGYVAGAVLAGRVSDRFGMPTAVATVGLLTAASGLWAQLGLAPRDEIKDFPLPLNRGSRRIHS